MKIQRVEFIQAIVIYSLPLYHKYSTIHMCSTNDNKGDIQVELISISGEDLT